MTVNLRHRLDHVPVYLAALTAIAFEGEEARRQAAREREIARKELEREGDAALRELQRDEEAEDATRDVHTYGNLLTILLRKYSPEGPGSNFTYRRNSYYLSMVRGWLGWGWGAGWAPVAERGSLTHCAPARRPATRRRSTW